MGICKCKRRTDLFCFVHKKAVCESCIVQEHKVCVVRTYVDWLTDSEYEIPVCGICKGEINEDNHIRLMCLDVFHPECLDVYASSLPPHTAKAGYLCPTCNKAMFPPNGESPLAQHLTQHLSQAHWATPLLSLKSVESTSVLSNQNEETRVTITPDGIETPYQQPSLSSNETSQSFKRNDSQLTNQDSTTSYSSMASRKSGNYGRDHSIVIGDEEDEDKYRKRGVMQLFTALGLIKPSKGVKGTKQTRIRLDTRRILIIFALIACLVTVILLGSSLTNDSPVDQA